ncbi:N-acetylgalactosamine-6-phosphate deacetylase [uncultured Gammaproteobacteria bacterium]
MDALCNARVFTGDSVLDDRVVLIEDGRIVDLVAATAIPPLAIRYDLGGDLLAPGFIDLQVNGGGGVLFNDQPTPAGLRVLAAAHRRFGTTGFLATLISDDRDHRRAARAAVLAGLSHDPVPGLLGLHLEGPHLATVRRGVHDLRYLGPPEAEDVALMMPLSQGPLNLGAMLVTLAPEVVPAAVITALSAAGTRVFLGHSAADYDQTQAALAAGACGFTHLYNAMTPISGREPGVAGAALDHPDSWCGIIADGHHLHDALIRLAWRAKPAGRLVLVTDAMSPVGGPVGQDYFSLYGQTVRVEGGRCLSVEGRLAGSVLDMAGAVRHCVQRVGIPLEEALRMASAYPAAALGLDGDYGQIAPGKIASLVLLDQGLRVRLTWLAGNISSLKRLCGVPSWVSTPC